MFAKLLQVKDPVAGGLETNHPSNAPPKDLPDLQATRYSAQDLNVTLDNDVKARHMFAAFHLGTEDFRARGDQLPAVAAVFARLLSSQAGIRDRQHGRLILRCKHYKCAGYFRLLAICCRWASDSYRFGAFLF